MVSKEAQNELLSIDANGYSEVAIPRTGKVYKIRWLRPDTTNRISRDILRSDVSAGMKNVAQTVETMGRKTKLLSQLTSYIILNDFWKNTLIHWLHWRYLYYVRQYDFNQLFVVVLEGKKKIPVNGYYTSMVFLVSMMDTMRTMTHKEAEQYLQELSSATKQPSEKSSDGQ